MREIAAPTPRRGARKVIVSTYTATMAPPMKLQAGAARNWPHEGAEPGISAMAAIVVAPATANKVRAAYPTLPCSDLLRAALAAAWTGIRAPATSASRPSSSVMTSPRPGCAELLPRAAVSSGSADRGGVGWLVEADLAPAGQPDRGLEPPFCFLDLGAGHPLGFERSHGRPQVVTHEGENAAEEIMLAVALGKGAARGMDPQLRGRKAENEPSATRVDRGESQDVAKERPIGLGVAAVEKDMSASDHWEPRSVRTNGTGHHPAGQLLYNLGSDSSGHSSNVLPRIVLHQVRPDDVSPDALHHRQHLPDRQAARIAMRDAGREGGIQTVEVDRDIHVAAHAGTGAIRPGRHVDHLDPEPIRLAALVSVHGANADLDQPAGQALFHDAGEWARVGQPITLELGVEVGMGVDVQNREGPVSSTHCAEHRVGDRVVAAQRKRAPSAGENR